MSSKNHVKSGQSGHGLVENLFTDQAIIGRWIMALEKCHFAIQQRQRTQH